MSKKYRQLMEDQVKKHIVKWATDNPDWSPEALIAVTKMLLKLYGIRNARYLPPDFKREEVEVPSADVSRVETADGGTPQSG